MTKFPSSNNFRLNFPFRLKNQQENARNVSSKIKNVFMGSDDELKEEIESFKIQHMQKQNELKDNRIALKCAESDLIKISKQFEENDRNYHLLFKDHEREKNLYAEKANYIQKMCEKLEINVDFDIENCNDHASDLVVNI